MGELLVVIADHVNLARAWASVHRASVRPMCDNGMHVGTTPRAGRATTPSTF